MKLDKTGNEDFGKTLAKIEQGIADAGAAPAWNSITGKPSTFTPPNATTGARGGVLQAAAQANSTATDVAGLVADFNALLAKLRTAGILAP